jgi:hypothetical protein
MNILILGRAIPQNPRYSTFEQLRGGFIQAGYPNTVALGKVYQQPRWVGEPEFSAIDKFDLVVYTEMNDGGAQYFDLKDHPKLRDATWLYWSFDVSYYPQQAFAFAKNFGFDGFLVANRFWVGRFAEIAPSIFLPYGFSPHIHRRLSAISKEHMFGFIGSMTPEREAMLADFKAHGIEVYVKEGVYGEDLIRETNKIGIMLHKQQGGCKGLCPGRPLEVGGCGTALLIHPDDWDDISPIYNNDYPFVGTAKDCVRGGYLHEIWVSTMEEADGLGMTLRKHLFEKHSYTHRASAIVDFYDHIN